MITLMGFRSLMPRIFHLLSLSVCVTGNVWGGQTGQVRVHRTVLSDAKHLLTTRLLSDAGLPVTVDYYNVRGGLKAITQRLAQEYPSAEGWKRSPRTDMAVFTNARKVADVKWQRVAAFKGKLDRALRIMPKTEGTWVNVVVYRVREG